jgi:hypothetical protein
VTDSTKRVKKTSKWVRRGDKKKYVMAMY